MTVDCEHLTTNARFNSRVAPPPGPRAPANWFLFRDDQMLFLPEGDQAAIPRATQPADLGLDLSRTVYMGYLEDEAGLQTDCFAAELPANAELPAGMSSDGLRGVYARVEDESFALAGRAVQLLAWDRTHRFCGQCGALTELMENERARRCPACALVSYPRLSPAIIIAIVRDTPDGRSLLMARNHRFPPGRYSVIAGYVEPGETLEECARREVCEEVGIAIQNIRYFASQPWPFPNSLMIAFTAEYAGGEIRVEESELADAAWFLRDSLPGLPPKISVARRLIDWFIESVDHISQ